MLEIRILSFQNVKQRHMYIYTHIYIYIYICVCVCIFFHSYVIVLIALVNLFWIGSKDTLRARNIDTSFYISLDKYSAHCQYRKCFVLSSRFSKFDKWKNSVPARMVSLQVIVDTWHALRTYLVVYWFITRTCCVAMLEPAATPIRLSALISQIFSYGVVLIRVLK